MVLKIKALHASCYSRFSFELMAESEVASDIDSVLFGSVWSVGIGNHHHFVFSASALFPK